MVVRLFSAIFGFLRPSSLVAGWTALRQMTFTEFMFMLLGLQIGLVVFVGRCGLFLMRLVGQMILAMSSDSGVQAKLKPKMFRATIGGAPAGKSIHLPTLQVCCGGWRGGLSFANKFSAQTKDKLGCAE